MFLPRAISVPSLALRWGIISSRSKFEKSYSEILMRSRKELLESAYDPGIASLDEITDEGLVATWMLEFLKP